jgi:hypothetical protein
MPKVPTKDSYFSKKFVLFNETFAWDNILFTFSPYV